MKYRQQRHPRTLDQREARLCAGLRRYRPEPVSKRSKAT